MPSRRAYKFYYFDMRGRGELTRLLFAYAGIEFEDVRISFQEWPKLKSAVPMGQLPILEFDDKTICQSTAIARFIAREYALAGKNNLEMAKADMLVEGVYDMWKFMRPILEPKMRGDQAKFEENWPIFCKDYLTIFLSRYEHFLTSSHSSWLIGDSITWADIAVAEYLSVCQGLNSEALHGHPNLAAFVARVFDSPRLKEYIEKRHFTPY